jgi:hypothetical protein
LKYADGSTRRVNGLGDNQIIYLAKVEMSHPYKRNDKINAGRFRLVSATTIDRIRFELQDDVK